MSLLKAQHALEQRVRSSASGGEVIQQSRVGCAPPLGINGHSFLWHCNGPATEEIVVAPEIRATRGVREISMFHVVETLNVKEGEQVKKGQVLLDPEGQLKI